MIDRDSLFNVLMNVAELKVEVKYLQGKVNNQKLIIQGQGVVIDQTELKVDILSEQVNRVNRKQFWPRLWAFVKGFAVGGVFFLLL